MQIFLTYLAGALAPIQLPEEQLDLLAASVRSFIPAVVVRRTLPNAHSVDHGERLSCLLVGSSSIDGREHIKTGNLDAVILSLALGEKMARGPSRRCNN